MKILIIDDGLAGATIELVHGAVRKGGIETLTLNGFRLEHTDSRPGEHTFRVVRTRDGETAVVTVAIDPSVVDRVARLTGRQLDPGGAYWRSHAERLLAGVLWTDGKPPADGRLVVLDLAREDVELATAWEAD